MASVRLSSVKIGENNLRFLYFRKPNLIYVTSIKQKDDVPLFLGGDILAASAKSSKNYCRIHSRYGKDGYATKLRFPGIKVEGINHSANLWFYTVQGLFAAVFEHLDLNAQRDCLVNLKDVWISTSYLPWDVNSELSVELLPEDIEANLNSISCETHLKKMKHPEKCAETKGAGQRSGTYSRTETRNSEQCSTMETCRKIHTIIDDHVKQSGTGEEDKGFSLLKIVVDLLCNNDLDNQTSLFLQEILDEYRITLNDSTQLNNFTEHMSLNFNVLLCVMSGNLGHQFSRFKKSISSNVDIFKTEHINQIDNLPSAEELVRLLFPHCMRIFMVAWMGTDGGVDPTGPIPKRRKLRKDFQQESSQDTESQPSNIFPFIQLILEFANNVLISGVAHVLYSRLLHSS